MFLTILTCSKDEGVGTVIRNSGRLLALESAIQILVICHRLIIRCLYLNFLIDEMGIIIANM